jgi:hypothetical protein
MFTMPAVIFAQVTNTLTLNYAPGFSATYFDNNDLTNPKATAFHRAINFDAFPFNGSPNPTITSDTFSARWTGKMVPFYSENYTIYAVTAGGMRVWINNQLVIDTWVDQFMTEHSSAPLPFTAGAEVDIKVEFFQNFIPGVAKLLWSSPSQPKVPVHYIGTPTPGFFDSIEHHFGANIASLGGGRFVVSSSSADEANVRPPGFFLGTSGFGWIYDQNGATVGFPKTPGIRAFYGKAVVAFPDGRFLVSGVGFKEGIGGFAVPDVGTIYLHDSAGNFLRAWKDPENALNGGAFVGSGTLYGNALAVLSANRFAVGSSNKVYIYDSAAVAPPVATIANPSPGTLNMVSYEGQRNLAALGSDRLLVGAAGKVLLFNLNGAHLLTIGSPNTGSDLFGYAVTAVDDHRFMVGAPFAAGKYFDGNQFLTNSAAGAAYLYDDTGALARTFTSPTISESRNFGFAISMLGPSRVLIGAPSDKVKDLDAGRVHVFNIDGVPLATIDHPAPTGNATHQFGATIEALDGRRFVVGAPLDDTRANDAGSVYGYDVPVPEVEIGSEIPRPIGVDASGLFTTQGPAVTPAGFSFWHVPSGKLFAIKPGGIRISWRLLNGQTNNWEGSLIWPTNDNRFQIHIAGSTVVDVSAGGAFSNVVLHATTAEASVSVTSSNRLFTAPKPGDSFLMLSPGEPSTSPIRFQFVRSIEWNDPARLHDNAPAIIGQPITDPGGYQNAACTGPQVVVGMGVYAPAPVYDLATHTGTIIPVNKDNPATASDDLVVAFFQRGDKLYDPVTGGTVEANICWPHKPVRYRPEWPTGVPKVVIASQQGTGAIDPAQFPDWELYFQNNPALAGFNPNDEHALRRPLAGGEAVFALRDDLGTPATSDPYVLIRYRDPAAGGRWRFKVWRVVAEESPFFFKYAARAGLLIQPPFPLSSLAPVSETVGVSGPYWRDRKLLFWSRAAGDDGGAAEIVMRYFYPLQPGFFMPGPNPPPLGADVPLLDLRAGTPGTPINVHFDTTWPADVPELRAGETLVKPKNGLPQISGQTSVEILYQQAQAKGQGPSVHLIDPIRPRNVPLAQLPPDVQTRVRGGTLYFPALPPHLENRVSYDPATRQLRFNGEFVEPPAGEPYLLLNVLTPRDKAAVLALTTDSNFRNAVESLAAQAAQIMEVPSNATDFDSLALTAGQGSSTGYVSLAFGNSTNLSAPAEPISVNVIRVSCPLYRGELKVIESPNPLAEQLTLRHSGDFAGRPDDFEFEWRTLPPVDGLPSTALPERWTQFAPIPATGVGAVDITITGPGLYTLSDNYFIARYRPRTAGACGADWSAWTAPMLAEGWIKRVLAGIGPFEQRIKDYQDTQVNTIVSMISQAGARAVGDVALNLSAVDKAGLIEVYETVLRRGMALSIDGVPPVDYPPANDALLLAAGRLADLYMLLGNEAYADAADPTIAFGTDDALYGSQATSLHCFMNQTATLLEEELALLRGRDNSRLPSVQTHPFYNRLIWNFTRDITGGEVAYALNYNLRNANGDVAGTIDEADARLLYPQGHGDAWGHYLMALKNYYRLLRSASFTWIPRAEAVLVGGVPVSVDFLDERKFAAAAAARARTGAEIVNLTFRNVYTISQQKPWQSQPDTDANRAWSLTDWAGRAGQGALFDWVVGNAILPDVDSNPNHTGIQKIERGSVRELPEIAEAYRQVQEQVDEADSGRNPLGLATDVVPFDIDPGGVGGGKTHFDQINERANEALKNAVAVFDHAHASTQLLRRQADDATRFQQAVADREADINNRLIEMFGTPYADDIGPTGTYPTGYTGPDIYHYDYVDNPELETILGQQESIKLQLTDLTVNSSGALTRATVPVVFHISANGFGLAKPVGWTGQRRAPGEIQLARLAGLESIRRLQRAVAEYENQVSQMEDAAALFRAELRSDNTQLTLRNDHLAQIAKLDEYIKDKRREAVDWHNLAESARILGDMNADALPSIVGFASDAFAGLKAILRATGQTVAQGLGLKAAFEEQDAQKAQDEKNEVAALTDLKLFREQVNIGQLQRFAQLEQLVRQERAGRLELAALGASVDESIGRYRAAINRGLQLLEDRTRFRQQTAAQIQNFRYKDMAFRVFRNDALQKYRAQFDLAARYAYLAAKAYDYETCLAPTDNRGPGDVFLTAIIRARSLGLIANGTPLANSGTGDPGLADPLARMSANWNLVLKGQLGFNNPQTETGRFSMRNELFRVLSGPGGSQRWRETLERFVVPNVLELAEYQRHCIPFTPALPVEPAIVIPFATTINFGLNFFGWPAGGGDNDYDSTKFATKVRSVGVWFANYNNLGGGMINTPRVYLVPVGLDVMRAPSRGTQYIREWRVLDQALPVPFPLNSASFSSRSWIPINDSLSEDFAEIRRFGRFRAFHDSGSFNPAETVTDTRLIGRSVWNTRWLLIIPAGTLHTDRNEGVQRFINGGLRTDGTRDGNGVSDIKIFFQTYAYSGN